MTAGSNVGIRVWRFSYSDDAVGGAVPTGTVLYDHLHARLDEMRPTTPLLEQGLEVTRLYRAIVEGRDNTTKEHDIIEITAPVNHYNYGDKFRALAVQRQSFSANDRRQYLIVTMSRIETSHGNEYQ